MFTCMLIVLALVGFFSQHVSGQNVTFLAGTGNQGYSGDNGPATSALMGEITGLWVDSDGAIFITDTTTPTVRRVGTDGIITRIGGTGSFSSSCADSGGSGVFTKIKLCGPRGIYGDSTSIYIADSYIIWKYTRATGIVTTFAGNGGTAFKGDGGPATSATISQPYDLWLSTDSYLYIAEFRNNLVRKIDLNTNIISIAAGGGGGGGGGGGFGGDGGPAVSTNTLLSSPMSVYIDSNSVIFIADTFNSRIRTIENGIINTYAGGGQNSNDGFAATLTRFTNLVNNVRGDTLGNIYIAVGYKELKVVDGATKIVSTYLSGVRSLEAMWVDLPNNRLILGMLSSVKTMPLYTTPTTAQPSYQPTLKPSAQPTTQPSSHPSSQPSSHPSSQPSSRPSGQPSSHPSSQPSSQPTSQPTTISTSRPSSQPSSQPSSHPSSQPISHPTSRPSSQPSAHPSSLPTTQPTMSPTAPTFKPTTAPSFSPTVKNDDVVKVSGTSRVKFVHGNTLNKLSLATLLSAFQNISTNAQSTVITSTVLVSTMTPQSRWSESRRMRNGVIVESVSSQAIPNRPSYTYDIGFLSTYIMTYHAGYTSSQLAAVKTTTIRQAIEVGQFDSTLRYLARAQNATQLLNGTSKEVTSLTSVVVPASTSSSSSSNNDDSLATRTVIGIVVGVLVGCLVLMVVLYVILKRYDDEKKRRETMEMTDNQLTVL